MKVILIQGAKNTGKTTLCNRIDEWLQKEFINEYFKENREKIEKMVVTKDISLDTDFFALYDIKQIKNINHKRIIINSLSDEVNQFYKFKEFFEEHKEEKTNVLKDVINSCFDILLKKEKDNNKKEIYKNIKEIYETKERCLKEIPDIPTSDVDTLKQKIKGFCDEIMERISQSYTPSKMPDLLITVIRPLGTNLYNDMKDILGLNLSDLKELKLSPTYHKDTSKDILLIKLEKTPLELIKEEIKKLFK